MTLAPEAPFVEPPPAAPPARRPRLLGRARDAISHDLGAPGAWPVLDSLRGAAVVAVIGWHVYRLTVTGLSPHAVPVLLWPLGGLRLAVDVFFVLSGFLVIRSWRSIRGRAATSFHALGDFWRRRARRILPAYWVSLVVLLAITARPVLQNPRHVLLFFSLNEYVRFVLPARVNVVYWSLTVEWHFYLLVPVIAFLMTRIGRWPMLAGTLFLSFMWWSHRPPMQLPQGFVFGHLDQFVVGAIVGELVVAHAAGHTSWMIRVARQRWFGIVVVLLMLAVGTYHGSTLGASRRNGFDPFMHPVFGLLAAAVILHLLTRSRRTFLDHRVLRVIGLISFSLYLWHYPILHRGIPWARRFDLLPSAIELPLSVVVFVALAFAVATLSYLLVERPFMASGRALKPAPAPVLADVAPISAPGRRGRASRLAPWPSRRSSASRPNTASRYGAPRTRTRSSRRAS